MHTYHELMHALDKLEIAAMRFGAASSRNDADADMRAAVVNARADISKALVGAFSIPAELRIAIEAAYPALESRQCKKIHRRLVELLEKLK